MTGIENKDYNDVIDKQENLAKNHPDLNTREKGVLATLDIKYEKGKDITLEDIDTAMNNRFDTELAKAGTSAETPEMKTRKDQLSKDIQNTKDMKEKIALYQAFLDGLKGDVGTQIAEQKQRE